MDVVLTRVVVGVLGTLVMDALNLLLARTGVISRIDVRMLGRMAVGWTRGRFRYGHPTEMEQVPNESLYGYVTHYGIGVGLAVPEAPDRLRSGSSDARLQVLNAAGPGAETPVDGGGGRARESNPPNRHR